MANSAILGPGNLIQALQAAIEAETVENTYISPDKIKFSPGVAKAWVNFDGTLGGPISPTKAYSVTSITDNGTGDYTINFSITFLDANYCVVGFARDSVAAGQLVLSADTTDSKTTTTLQITTSRINGAFRDASEVGVAIFGDI